MTKDTSILTIVVLLVIVALAVAAIPTVKKLTDRLSDPLDRVEQVARVR